MLHLKISALQNQTPKICPEITSKFFLRVKVGLSVEFLPIKRLKKRYKFKVTKNILCVPPKYPKKEVKRITAVIEYIPHLTSSAAQFRVDHLPYGTKAKGITYIGE